MGARRLAALCLALLLALLMSACFFSDGDEDTPDPDVEAPVPEENAEYPVRVGSAEVGSRPVKVVSLAPALTEKLDDLGFTDRLEGVSDYCDWPSGMALPSYGTAQYPDFPALEALSPHVILLEGLEEEMDAQVLAQLRELDAAVVILSHAGSVAEWEEMYITLATVMEGKTTGQIIGEQFVQNYLRPRLDALPSIGGGAPGLYLRALDFTVATGDTLEGELLERMGYQNIAGNQRGFLYEGAESEEGVAAFRSVEMILMDEEYVTITNLEQSAYYKSLPATIQDRYVYIDSLLFERQSLRLLDHLYEIVEALRGFE